MRDEDDADGISPTRSYGNHRIRITTFHRIKRSEWASSPSTEPAHENGTGVADKPRRAPEALRARGNELRKLLASPLKAVVVTDDNYRFLVTNPKALDLFGVSPTNVTKFTIDIFLSHGQVLNFTRNASHFTAFIRRRERHGKCKIRRLDGSLRVAEYVFVANFAPRRHVFRFRDVTPQDGPVQFNRGFEHQQQHGPRC